MLRYRAWLLAAFLLVFGLVGALHVHDPVSSDDGDNCAICHVLSQGASGVAPDLIVLAVVGTSHAIVFAPHARQTLHALPGSPIRSRGPPALI
jgi:hypothetical protein